MIAVSNKVQVGEWDPENYPLHLMLLEFPQIV
jgi:hypothetical protein